MVMRLDVNVCLNLLWYRVCTSARNREGDRQRHEL